MAKIDMGAVVRAAERHLDELESSCAGSSEIKRFLVDVFVLRNRAIRNADFRRLDPATVVDDYLVPRRNLYCFLVIQWVRRVFVPSLRPRVAQGIFIFGLGRLFSIYNDMGVQHCTDVDLNVIARDGMSAADFTYLRKSMLSLKEDLRESFGIDLEVDPAFTVLRAKEVASRLRHPDEAVREANLRFYKSNERSIFVIVDQPEVREEVFSLVRAEPDCRLFENFLGLECSKQSYAKLRSGVEMLSVAAMGGTQASTGAVIGCKSFDEYCRRFLHRQFLSPPDWVFSMKYFVNRVYDYVGAMRNLGYSLEEIGFGGPSSEREGQRSSLDPDYRYLRNAHKLMLYLQELITLTMGSFNAENDSSYISRDRFLRFMEVGGDKFKHDFDDMVVKGDLLYLSDKEKYRTLKHRIETKSRDRLLTGKASELALFPHDLLYDVLYLDSHSFKICVPYSWGDLGYFVFSAIAARIATIVDGRLIPRLLSFGASEDSLRRYFELLG